MTDKILTQIKKAVVGKDKAAELVLMAVLAGGHVLLEDVPGVGKTTLALAVTKSLGLDCRRVQFTPDTMASDITGYTAYDREKNGFVFHEGAAMTNILFADEVNRTSSRTQSALLEVMEEGACTVDGQTYEVPKPFVVIATQNPFGSAGTSPLPSSQLDRFMIKLSMGYPDRMSMKNILSDRHDGNPLEKVETVCSKKMLEQMQEQVRNVFVDDKIYDYISLIAEKTRSSEYVELGLSPRGALALCRMAKAKAFCEKRSYVVPEDVRAVMENVCAHRLVLSAEALAGGITAKAVVEEIKEMPQE